MQFIITGIIFLLSSAYVLLIDYLAVSSRSLQQALVISVFFLILALYRLPQIIKKKASSYEKWFFLFWGSILLQMLILSTGSIQSPLIILLYLALIGLSLVFSFSVGLLFLFFSLVVIAGDIVIHHTFITLFLANPGEIILETVSLLVIVPITYIISYKYHIRDWLFSTLRSRITTDEVILEHLDELIIITDSNLTILSINEAVEKTLSQSRAELIDKPLFNVLIIKDAEGNLVTKETFFPNGDTSHQPVTNTHTLTLFGSAIPKKEVSIQVQSINDEDTNTNQISFIITYNQKSSSLLNVTESTIERARVKYEALNENMKRQLKNNFPTLETQMLLLEKIETDIYDSHILQEHASINKNSRIDLSILCKKIAFSEKTFATAFGVTINFKLRNFGMKDITPFLAGNFSVKPEKFTGHFFTASCDVKKMEILIKKLIDICIFLSSKEKNKIISVEIERKEEDKIVIEIISSCPLLERLDIKDIFIPYYGKLGKRTNLHLGSGLEGYLIKTLTTMMDITLDTQLTKDTASRIIFTLTINKNFFPS